jgi:hypothetical protein
MENVPRVKAAARQRACRARKRSAAAQDQAPQRDVTRVETPAVQPPHSPEGARVPSLKGRLVDAASWNVDCGGWCIWCMGKCAKGPYVLGVVTSHGIKPHSVT